MKREFFVLCLILGMVLLISNVSGSAIYETGCEINLKVIDSSIINDSFFINIINQSGCNNLENNIIYEIKFNNPKNIPTQNKLHSSIYSAPYINLIEIGACPLTESGEVSCWEGWQLSIHHNYSEIPLHINSLEPLTCESNSDCYFGMASLNFKVCGGCYDTGDGGEICYYRDPFRCYLYQNNVECVNGFCGFGTRYIEEEQQVNFFQKIINWFKNLFS